MADALDSLVRSRAHHRCEYCGLPESATILRHVLDHIIARQHHGATRLDNLALCCGRCNAFKGPNIATLDPRDGALTRLFNPRSDRWGEHFQYDGAVLDGLSAVGRSTVDLLAINLPSRVRSRAVLLQGGFTFA